MQIYIYMFNKNNLPLGIYEYKKLIHPKNERFYKTSVDYHEGWVYGENIHNEISSTLIGIKGLTVIQSKIIYRNKDKEAFFYVKVNNEILDESIVLMPYFSSIDNHKIENRIISKYNKYLSKVEKKIKLVKGSLFLPSIYDVINIVLSIIISLISLILDINKKQESGFWMWFAIATSTITVVKYIGSLIERIKSFNNRYYGTNCILSYDKKSIQNNIINNLSKEYKDFTYSYFVARDSSNSEFFLFSDSENEKLRKNGDKIKVVKSKNKMLKSEDAKTALGYIYKERVNSGKIIYNHSLSGIDSELNFYENNTIKIKKVKYFDYVSNDDIIYKNFTLSCDPKFYLSGTKHTLYPNGGFRNIEGSHLTNLIGVNIICVLNVEGKKYLIINRQGTFSDVSNNKFVPSGSGSLDYSDFKKMKKESFEKLLKTGMYRELKEEASISYDFITKHNPKFSLLGVARLSSKAGKPDFFGMVELDVTEEDIDNILKLYNKTQNKVVNIYKNVSNVESSMMAIIDYNEFMKKDEDGCPIYQSDEAIQLRYVKYLLSKNYK